MVIERFVRISIKVRPYLNVYCNKINESKVIRPYSKKYYKDR